MKYQIMWVMIIVLIGLTAYQFQWLQQIKPHKTNAINEKIHSWTVASKDVSVIFPDLQVTLISWWISSTEEKVFEGQHRRTKTYEKNGYMIKLVQRQKSVLDNGGGALLNSLDYVKLPTNLNAEFWRNNTPYSLEWIGPWSGPIPVYMDLFVLDELFETPQHVGSTKYFWKALSELNMGSSALMANYLIPVTVEQYKAGDYNQSLLNEMDQIIESLW